MNSEEVSGALPSARAGALRAEPAAQSQAEPLVPNAAAFGAWWGRRMTSLREERRDALAGSDEYSAACATGAMLELYELQSFLIASGMSAFGQDPKGLEAKPASPVGNAETPKHPSE